MIDQAIREKFKTALSGSSSKFVSIRYHDDLQNFLSVRQDVLQPYDESVDKGYMATVLEDGGLGYAASQDTSLAGIRHTIDKATDWAKNNKSRLHPSLQNIEMEHPTGEFISQVKKPWDLSPLIERLQAVSRSLKISDKIVDWHCDAWRNRSQRLYLTNQGGDVFQDFDRFLPMIRVTANNGIETQSRSLGFMAFVRQQGLELLEELAFDDTGIVIAEQAIELLSAPNCPTGNMDLLLSPDQMLIQIHESIGHPIELDRILGDERNYAGTSFVTQDMFGTYQYGSELLNVVFDPTRSHQAASFNFDDDGMAAKKVHVIKDGLLVKPLGGAVSGQRAGMAACATARADSWRRPAIDRMSNLNVEPGSDSFSELVGSVENGILMETNASWSIDDSRNKFQFSCERGRLIKDGELQGVVRNPNYRGTSAKFWRNLKAVGDESTFCVLGTPYCGKGEPNQAVFVGHASPACVFSDCDVFGGDQ